MAEVIIVKNQEEAGELYGRSVADLIKAKPNAVLGLATGSSPLAAYQALAKIVEEESIDVSQVQGFALDEYIGLPLTHPESYHATIHRTVVAAGGRGPAQVDLPRDRRHRAAHAHLSRPRRGRGAGHRARPHALRARRLRGCPPPRR